eukprot:4866090-Pleurochrysis_carterae.AAC.2
MIVVELVRSFPRERNSEFEVAEDGLRRHLGEIEPHLRMYRRNAAGTGLMRSSGRDKQERRAGRKSTWNDIHGGRSARVRRTKQGEEL